MKRLGAAAAAFVLGLGAVAWAEHVAPEVYGDQEGEENNPSCAFLNSDWNEVKVNEAPNGSHSDDDGALVFTVENSDGKVFDWKSNIGIDAVVVKGGNRGSNVYFYRNEPKSDENLRSPDNTKDNTPAVSHISACYDEEPEDNQNERPSEPENDEGEQPEKDEGEQPSQPEDEGDEESQPNEPQDDGGREEDGGNQRPAEPDEPQDERDEPGQNERQAEPDEGDGEGGEEEQTTEDEQDESGEGEGGVEGVSETDEGTSDDDASGEVLQERSDSGDDLPFTGAPLGMLLIAAIGLLFAGAAGRRATRG